MLKSVVFSLFMLTACGGKLRTFPAQGDTPNQIDHAVFQELLGRYVTKEGSVDYASWDSSPEDLKKLKDYLGNVTNFTPETHPELYPKKNDTLSYWINLYNALVIAEVLHRWPLSSVRDVKEGAKSYFVPGKGFFAGVEFRVSRKSRSLDDIEHEILRNRYADPRIHFAINCASSSCPVLQPEAFNGRELEKQLDDASKEFINDPDNVRVVHEKRRVYLSKIFDWYRGDFVSHIRASRGAKAGIVDFLLLFANAQLATDLKRAKENGYKISYLDYDWGVNNGEKGPAEPSKKDSLPGIAYQVTKAEPAPWTGDVQGKVVLLDFWATYCAPCKEGMPWVQSLYEKYRGQGFEVVAISLDENPQIAQAFFQGNGIRLPLASDPDSVSFESSFAIKQLPTQIVYGKDGQLLERIDGYGDKEKLEALIQKALSQ